MRAMRRLTAAGAVLLALAPALAPAAAPADRESEVRALAARLGEQLAALRGEERSLDAEARRLDAELARVRAESIVAARSARRHEEAVSRLGDDIAALADERARTAAALQARRAVAADTLAALTRLALLPPEALLAMPGDANDIVRGGLVLGGAVPRLEARAAALRRELAALDGLAREIGARRAELAAASRLLAAERALLDDLMARKAALRKGVAERRGGVAERIERLAGEARDLADLLRRLEEDGLSGAGAPAPPPPASGAAAADGGAGSPAATAAPPLAGVPIADARGALVLPVRGTVVRRYGEATGYGRTARGVSLRTLPGARVVAPHDGRVAFVGPFRDFGLVLIIEHGGGYHSVIVGMAATDAVVGQWVVAGEPMGTAAGGTAEQGDGGPVIGVELRRDGRPIDPLPWFQTGPDRVGG